MKNLFVAIHRQTYGVIYYLFCRHHSSEECLSSFKRHAIFYKCLCSVIFVLLFVLVMNKPSFNFQFHPDPLICQSVELMKSNHEILLNSMKYHIALISYLHKINSSEFSLFIETFSPISKKILDRKLPICHLHPPGLQGKIIVNENINGIDKDFKKLKANLKKRSYAASKMYEQQTTNTFTVQKEYSKKKKNIDKQMYLPLPLYIDEIPYGINSPQECLPHRRTAVIIPYRNRKSHLQLFLRHMHEIMTRQQIEYGIYVINLAGRVQFNRAKLLNVGFQEALLHYKKYDCIIFHDVDLLPENDANLYTCESEPKHMSVSINIFDYKLPYTQIFGGVTAMTPLQFRMVNGYSNSYWGWGGEDDDMFQRLSQKCMSVLRPPFDLARYRMLEHSSDKGNEVTFERYNLLKTAGRRQQMDGLSTLTYKVLKRDYQLLYNNITVYIGHPEYPPQSNKEMGFRLLAASSALLILYFTLLR